MSFLVLSLPRSRSAWLAAYLGTASQLIVTHDFILDCNSIFDFAGAFVRGDLSGSCETGLSSYWKTIRKLLPEVRLITLHRPLDDVLASFDRLGYEVDIGQLEEQEFHLNELTCQPDVEAVNFEDLSDPICAKWLFGLCFPLLEWDAELWQRMNSINYQIDFPKRFEKIVERQPQIHSMKAEIEEFANAVRH